MTGADLAVFVGMGAMIAGVWGAFGWPYAAMLGGFVLFIAGAKLQQVAAAKSARAREVAE